MFPAFVFLCLLAISYGSPVTTNTTIDLALSRLIGCASSDSENDRLLDLIDNLTLNQRKEDQLCGEKWLPCLVPSPSSASSSERHLIILLLQRLNLCSGPRAAPEPSGDNGIPISTLSLLVVVNLAGMVGAFVWLSYRSDCRLGVDTAD